MKKEITQKLKWQQVWASFVYCMTLSWKASKTYTILQFFCRILTAFLPVAITWDTKCIMDLFAAGGGTRTSGMLFFRYMLLLLGLYLIRLLAGQVSTYVSAMQYDLFQHYIEQEMAQMAVGMELEYFDNPKYYDAFESAKRDIYSVMGAVSDGVAGISYGITAVSCAAMLFSIAPVYTVCILAASVPVAISEHTYTKKLYRWGLEHMREERQMNYLYRVVTERRHAQEIRLFDIGEYLLGKYRNIWTDYFHNKKKVAYKRACWNLLLSTLPEILAVLALFSVGKDVLEGVHTVGDFTLYTGLLSQLTMSLQLFVMSVMGLYEKKLKIDHFAAFGQMVEKKVLSGDKHLSMDMDIEFSHVSFRYPGTEQYALKDISFSLHIGEKIAIVGENGAGKTTLTKLLLRFYEPEDGAILINGLPVEAYDIKDLRSRFSCFFQQADNYAFSLKENVMISWQSEVETAEREDAVENALAMAGAKEMADGFPYGMDTCLTRAYQEDGVELSGGQNQKVALARMFYRDAQVLVLDEPTAALDPKAEYELFQTIQRDCTDKSMLFVSHRLSNVYLADRILVMEHGEIRAQGTHTELMEGCEIYQRLYHYQADKYLP